MKCSIKIGLHVKPNNKREKVAEEAAIRIRVSWSCVRADLRSGYVIAPSKWDDVNSCVKLGAKNSYKQTAGEINRALINLSAKAEEVLTRFELDYHRAPTVKEFKAAFDEITGRVVVEEKEETAEQPLGFFDVFDRFTSEMGATNNWTKATYTKFSSIKTHLRNFRPELSLTDFSKADFAAFVSYLQHEEGQLNTTVAKNVGFLRWFLRWAASNGYFVW